MYVCIYIYIKPEKRKIENTRFLYCIYEYCTRWKYGTSCTVACSLPRERVVDAADRRGSCVSSLFSSLSSIVVFRAFAVFPPAFEIAACRGLFRHFSN